MIVAQHGDRAEPVVRDRLEHLAPGRPIGRRRRPSSPTAGQYQSVNSFSSSSHCSSPCGRQARHRRMPVEVDQHVGRKLVQFALARRVVVESFAQPPVAEIAEQQQAPVEVAGEDLAARSSPTDASHSATATNGRGSSCGGGASISTARAVAARRPGNSGGTRRRRQAAGFRAPAQPQAARNSGAWAGGIIGAAIALPMTGAPWLSSAARRLRAKSSDRRERFAATRRRPRAPAIRPAAPRRRRNRARARRSRTASSIR